MNLGRIKTCKQLRELDENYGVPAFAVNWAVTPLIDEAGAPNQTFDGRQPADLDG